MNLKANNQTLVLQPQEKKILLALLGRRVMWHTDLAEILWPDADLQPETWAWVIAVSVCRIRIELKRVGSDLKIICQWKRGYMVV